MTVAEALFAPAHLLAFLRQRGGQEHRVTALRRAGKGKRATVRDLGEYLLTSRGPDVLACGPQGQPRLLPEDEFCAIFGGAEFTTPQPTGVLTDLGPLFSEAVTSSP